MGLGREGSQGFLGDLYNVCIGLGGCSRGFYSGRFLSLPPRALYAVYCSFRIYTTFAISGGGGGVPLRDTLSDLLGAILAGKTASVFYP